MSYFRADPRRWMKSGQSPVSEADIAVDRELKAMLLSARPDHGWLSEETPDDPSRLAAVRTFVVDPIDGTRAFLDGLDDWCISIAVVERGRPVAGVLASPARGERWRATEGGGAFRGDTRLRVGTRDDNALVGGPQPMVARARQATGLSLRQAGNVPSLALRLAMVAAGEFDATFVKPNAHDWDLAASDLLLREAGGALVDDTGRTLVLAGADPRRDMLVAGSGHLLELLWPTLSSTGIRPVERRP